MIARWRRLGAIASIALACVAACAAQPSAPANEPPLLAYAGKDFHAGDTVRIISRSGTFKPEDTGHAHEINGAPGHAGVVVSAARRSFDPPDAALVVLRVRWPAQQWQDVETGEMVAIPQFESTIHASYLAVVE